MEFRHVLLDHHARAHAPEVGAIELSLQHTVLRGVPEAQMRLRPHPGFNSLAWLFWHMTRSEDIGVNSIIAERTQVLDHDGWLGRLGVARRDLGSGMTDDEVDRFNARIDVAALLAYRGAVGRQTHQIIRVLPPDVLDQVIDRDLLQRARDDGAFGARAAWVPQRWLGKPKAFTLTWTVLTHTLIHLGEGLVVRRLLGFDTL